MILRSKNPNDLMVEFDKIHPKVSVVMSCFNSASWLSQSIESVLSQSMDDFEFIIVDDGSTDDSFSIIKRYSESDKRIKVIAKKNTGLADSLNVGVSKSIGLWVARIDSDDIWNTDRLSRQVKALAEIDDCVYMGSWYNEFNDENGYGKLVAPPCDHRGLISNMLTGRRIPAHSTALIRRDAFIRLNGYRPLFSRSQDLDLWLRLAEIGRLSCLAEPLVRVRLHQGQISHTDEGIAQLKYSMIAVCFYWLRLWGVREPGLDSQYDFDRFYSWVEAWIERNEVTDTFIFKRKIQTSLKRQGLSSVLLAITQAIKEPGNMINLLMCRIPNMAVPRKMAAAWIKLK